MLRTTATAIFLRIFLVLLLVFPAPLVRADEVTTLTANADNTLDAGLPGTNNGTALTVGTLSAAGNNQRGLVRFDLSTIPSTSAVKTSLLKMKLLTPPGASRNQSAHRITGIVQWTEGGSNWTSRDGTVPNNWSTPGGDFYATAADTQASGTTLGSIITWTIRNDGGVSNIPQGWVDGSLTNNGLLLKDQVEDAASSVSHQEMQSGTSKNILTVTTSAAITGVTNHLYLAAISSRPNQTVSTVSGLGLTWNLVKAQCGGQGTTRVEVWSAQGSPTGNTTVTATFPGPTAPTGAVILVSRYSGVDTNPIGAVVSANRNGVNGACSGATNSNSYSVNLTTTVPNSYAYGAVAKRQRTHTPGTGYTERGDIRSGTGTGDAGVATEDKEQISPATIAVDGTLNNNTDWAVVGIEIKQQSVAPRYGSNNQAADADRPKLEAHYLRNVSLGGFTATASSITLNWSFPASSTCGGGAGDNYNGVVFARKQGASAPSLTPSDGTTYTLHQEPVAGEFIAATQACTATFVDENGPDNVILPGTQYTYKAFTRDNSTISGAAQPSPPHYALGVSASVTTDAGGGGGGNEDWSYKTEATTLAAPGLVAGGTVISGGNDNKLHAMSGTDGGRRYQPNAATETGTTPTMGAIQSRSPVIPASFSSVDCDTGAPGVQNCDVAYVGTGDGKVYAFNASTGAKLWESAVLTNPGGWIQGAPAVQVDAFSNASYPHAFDLVIVGTRNLGDNSNNKIYGLNGSTGSVVWTFNPGSLDIINSTPMIDYSRNEAWVTSRNGAGGTQASLWKLDTTRTSDPPAPLASYNLGNIDQSPTLNFDRKQVYVVANSGSLVAVRTDIAACTFSANPSTGAGVGFPIPINIGASNDDIYYSTATTVNNLNFTYGAASCSGTFTTPATGWVNPSISNPSTPILAPITSLPPTGFFIYVSSSDGKIHKIDPSNGTDLAQIPVVASGTVGDPSFDTGSSKLYVGATDGRIYAFDLF
jgi:outer membrane protein assembly factor BamB